MFYFNWHDVSVVHFYLYTLALDCKQIAFVEDVSKIALPNLDPVRSYIDRGSVYHPT
jgi:hypothetical protein